MNISNLDSIKRRSFVSGAISALAFVFFFHFFLDSEKYTFRLAFSWFDVPIEQVIIRFENHEWSIKNPPFESIGTSDSVLWFFTPESHGEFDLTVITQDGAYYDLYDIKYKSGHYNYIAKHGDKIGYTTGHW